MDHVAIMKKSWGFTRKIFMGKKSVESRWYKTRRAPWGKVRAGETIYFKDSGDPVTLKAKVEKVIQYSDLTPSKIQEIIDIYGKVIGLDSDGISAFFEMIKNKKYCILIFLKNPEQVEPFEIDKTGFGAMTAWITVEDVNTLRRRIDFE